mmetsp:Transcript_6775/g.9865  ORF Transcript_6775/g.9865 Transcript_6775/m.9865 type:complete len:88 (-) Transcript_6775:129-392(-)
MVLKSPYDLLKVSLDEKIDVKLKENIMLKGILHGYDKHLNMVLEDVEETKTDVNVETEKIEVTKRNIDMLFVRGDTVILVNTKLREE